eukprot:jgi/Picre1/30294/NNA_005658.t1
MANGVRLVDLLKRDSEWEFCRAEELGQVEVETCPVTRLAVDDMAEASGLAEAPPPEYHVDMTSVQRGHVSGGWERHDCDDDGFEYPASLTQGSPGCGKMAWSSRVDVLRSEKDRPVEDAGPAKRVLMLLSLCLLRSGNNRRRIENSSRRQTPCLMMIKHYLIII